MKKWYNIELTKKEWGLFKKFLEAEEYQFEASELPNNWKHIEVFAAVEDVEKMDKYLQIMDQYEEIL